MPTRNVNLTDALDAFVEQAVRSGRYGNASEVVRDALRRLEGDMAERAARLAALDAAIEEGERDHAEGGYVTLDGPEAIEAFVRGLATRATAE